jgi:maltose O-acetyltransferase
MVAGELYDAGDPELVAARRRARELCHELGRLPPGDRDGRRRVLTSLFGTGGAGVSLEPPFWCDYGVNLHVGERVFFNFDCVVLDVCRVDIGAFTQIGPAVQIYTATHPMDAMARRERESGRPVTIGSDVWIGGGAIICPGVTIGSRSVIGAGSVVTKDVPEGVFAAGNPARVIRAVS